MDKVQGAIALAQLINAGVNTFAAAQGKAVDPTIGAAIDSGLKILGHAQELAGLLVRAHAEARDITDAELDGIARGDDEARAELVAAIERAGGGLKPDAP